MKKLWSKVLAELLKNSKQSDRELAQKLGVSQPTVSRIRGRLEKEGYIKEYTIIPDFSKLGYRIMAITFALSRALDKEAAEKARKTIIDSVKNKQFEFVMLERGMGLGFDAVVVSFHKNYASYTKVKEWLSQFEFLDVEKNDSFLIDLDDEMRYRPLTFSTLAKDLLSQAQKKE